jgi:hypothetical protein
MEHALAWLIQAPCYKLEGHGFNWLNTSSSTKAPESPQLLTAMSTMNFPGGKGWLTT